MPLYLSIWCLAGHREVLVSLLQSDRLRSCHNILLSWISASLGSSRYQAMLALNRLGYFTSWFHYNPLPDRLKKPSGVISIYGWDSNEANISSVKGKQICPPCKTERSDRELTANITSATKKKWHNLVLSPPIHMLTLHHVCSKFSAVHTWIILKENRS